RRRGMSGDEIDASLQVVNRCRFDPPAPAEHVRTLALSFDKYASADVPWDDTLEALWHNTPDEDTQTISGEQADSETGELTEMEDGTSEPKTAPGPGEAAKLEHSVATKKKDSAAAKKSSQSTRLVALALGS